MEHKEEGKKEWHFEVPTKKIANQNDVRKFHGSDAYRVLLDWIKALNASVLKVPNSAECVESDHIKAIRGLVAKISKLVDDTPPEEGSWRFGNRAFRTFHAKLTEQAPAMHEEILPEDLKGAVIELVPYILDSFGNPIRIDYGTGHELHFVVWLYCLHRLGLIQRDDFTAAVIHVFKDYLYLVRKIQQTYGQEPAGSRGVWCLDDHQFIPFIWGAAQLIDHPEIQPASIMNKELMEKLGDEYLYLGCIRHINRVKSGPFFEHSPDLYNISGAANWEKINKGMLMKYNDDVLSKWPVLQHLLFGSLFYYDG